MERERSASGTSTMKSGACNLSTIVPASDVSKNVIVHMAEKLRMRFVEVSVRFPRMTTRRLMALVAIAGLAAAAYRLLFPLEIRRRHRFLRSCGTRADVRRGRTALRCLLASLGARRSTSTRVAPRYVWDYLV